MKREGVLKNQTPTVWGTSIYKDGEVILARFNADVVDRSYPLQYRGMFTVTYDHLVRVFGLPTTNGDGEKSDAVWAIKTPDGLALIYNWKTGRNYGDKYALDVEEILGWQMKVTHHDVVPWIEEALQRPYHYHWWLP